MTVEFTLICQEGPRYQSRYLGGGWVEPIIVCRRDELATRHDGHVFVVRWVAAKAPDSASFQHAAFVYARDATDQTIWMPLESCVADREISTSEVTQVIEAITADQIAAARSTGASG